ncbi:MAG: PEP-CTERM sorting domain-containing protein [Myxococcales bacterium]|jgi:PEP-CTERM putative exosortase interaction domain|nr:PEP-CTERM sorting domain-containing protein [Myxococcales bacterium]
MRLIKSIFVIAVVTMMVASSAQALVTVNASSAADGTTQSVGFTFDVDINVTWDGAGGALGGIFTSHTWDSSQLSLIGADSTLGAPGMFETRPNIFAGSSFAPVMGRFGTIAAGVAGDDLSASARTVQYGSVTPIAGSRAGTDLVVRLTFQIVGAGDGVAEITNANLLGDTGAQGDTSAFGTGVAVAIPEPGTALLMGLGLLGLAGAGRRKA